MNNLATVEIKAFVPSQHFEVSKAFYQAMGFTLAWNDDQLAYFHHGNSSFLLQNFYDPAHASNFMMHLLVEDVDAWHAQITAAKVTERFNVTMSQMELQPWRMRDFVIYDPSGVLWRIGQNVD
jgi:uncharacterized glyoxalase superfamily protein PhnB